MSGGGVGATSGPAAGSARRPRRRRTRGRCRLVQVGRRGGRRGRACTRRGTRPRRRVSPPREHAQVGLGDRHAPRPTAAHAVLAVEAAGAGDQPRRVDHVRRAALVHVDRRGRASAARARRSRPRGRSGCGSAAARAGARRRAPSSSVASSRLRARDRPARRRRSQQQMTRSSPWWRTSIARIADARLVRRRLTSVDSRAIQSAHAPPPARARPALDDAHLRGPLDREGVQRALPAQPGQGPDRACRSRSTCRRRPATTPTTSSRAARSARSACRSPTAATWRRCWTASRSTR